LRWPGGFRQPGAVRSRVEQWRPPVRFDRNQLFKPRGLRETERRPLADLALDPDPPPVQLIGLKIQVRARTASNAHRS
jgi:hypothetical protein